MTRQRLMTAAAAGGTAAVLLAAGCGGDDGRTAGRPNFVLIVADDLADRQFGLQVMPRTHEIFGDGGTLFDEHWVSTALCCPSRATFLTGQYAHNHGVLSNQAGYPALVDPGQVLPAWLRDAGYRTSHIGKYLNGHQKVIRGDDAGPGWERWSAVRGPTYYGYRVNSNDEDRTRSDSDEYSTTYLNSEAVSEIEELAGDAPFLLQIDHLAPHTESRADSGGKCGVIALPAPRDQGAFADVPLPKPPSFNEADVSDKPPFIEVLPPLTDRQLRSLERRWQCALATVQEIDRGVKMVVEALDEADELDDTVLIFVSDHGVFYGEHRIFRGKTVPYAAVHEAPLAVRIPARFLDRPAQARSREVVANVDIVPTILELAGADACLEDVCRVMDGRSLLPLIDGSGEWPSGRAVALEYEYLSAHRYATCAFSGFRTAEEEFVVHRSFVGGSGDCDPADVPELYDLESDPHELANLCSPECPAGREPELRERLSELESCSGIRGRDPEPASGSYCE